MMQTKYMYVYEEASDDCWQQVHLSDLNIVYINDFCAYWYTWYF